MARQVQLRRGTTAENINFTGAAGELTFDTDNLDIRVHNGSQLGGFEIPSIRGENLPAQSAHIKYSNGLMIQWAYNLTYTSISGNVMTRTMAQSFVNTNYTVIAVVSHTTSDTGAYWLRLISDGKAVNSFNYFMYLNNAVTTNNPPINYIAIGRWK